MKHCTPVRTGTSIPFTIPLGTMSQQQLFAELSRIEQLVGNLNASIDKLVAGNNEPDILLAAQIQEYKIRQESQLVRIRAYILASIV